jgi:hypothetical protein
MTNPSTNPVATQLMRATVAQFEAERQSAIATIQLYLNASVGVGEHPDVVTELVAAASRLASAEESIDTLQRNFMRTPSDETKE